MNPGYRQSLAPGNGNCYKSFFTLAGIFDWGIQATASVTVTWSPTQQETRGRHGPPRA